MTQPIPATSGATSNYPTPARTPAPTPTPVVDQGGQAAAATTIEVSRAASAPVYVYRVTDTATGRTLVEIPQEPAAPLGEGTGRLVDAKV